MSLIHVPGILLPNSAVEAYVCPADIVTNRVNFSFINNDSVSRQVEVWIVPAGGSMEDAFKIIGSESAKSQLRSGEPRPYPTSQVLTAGDKIFWVADDDEVVTAHLDINEVPAAGITLDGFTRKYQHGADDDGDDTSGFLPDALEPVYTVPENGQIIQFEAMLHNIDPTTRQAFAIRAVPSGQDAGENRWLIASGTQKWHVPPGTAVALQFEHFLPGGTEIHWRAAIASKIVGRLGIEAVEF